jgi:hypothetical protein
MESYTSEVERLRPDARQTDDDADSDSQLSEVVVDSKGASKSAKVKYSRPQPAAKKSMPCAVVVHM